MQVKCNICGGSTNITKVHKDYQKLAKHPDSLYICETCCIRIQLQMQNRLEFRKKK